MTPRSCSGRPSAKRRPPNGPRPNWRATPPRPRRSAARPRSPSRPLPNSRAKRKRPRQKKRRLKSNVRLRATRATPPARSESSRWLRRGATPTGRPIEASLRDNEAARLRLLHAVVFLHAIGLFHAVVLLHGVLGHGVFLHAIVLAHLVLGEGGRRKRQAERKRGRRYSEHDAGANGHWFVIL